MCAGLGQASSLGWTCEALESKCTNLANLRTQLSEVQIKGKQLMISVCVHLIYLKDEFNKMFVELLPEAFWWNPIFEDHCIIPSNPSLNPRDGLAIMPLL